MSNDNLDETLKRLLVDIGGRLRVRRHALGRTVREVALDAGLSLPYVANLENGRGNPTLKTLHQLATTLELPLSKLLGSADQPTESTDTVTADLLAFARTDAFGATCDRLAQLRDVPRDAMRGELLRHLASCPRPTDRAMTDHDWLRLLDAITLILT